MSKSIEEEVARTLEDLFDGDCGQGVGQDAAAVLMPLLNRVRAEALREAAHDARNYGHGGCYDFSDLMARADRIEQNSEGSINE